MKRSGDKKSTASALQFVRQSKTDKVKVAVTDLDGILRGKYLHKDKFLAAADGGFGFCNVVFGWDCNDVCYDNVAYTGWHTAYPDAQARLDLATFRKIPWENNLPFFLGDFVDAQGEPLEVCPRQLLKSVIARAEKAGFSPTFGAEFEWFNFRETPQSLQQKNYAHPEPATPGMFGYSLLRAGYSRPYFSELMDLLNAFGVPIEGLHTETGPGVYEAAIAVAPALEAADRAVLFKSSAKEIAYRHGLIASFMAKWNAKLPGCSGHLHQSLWDRAGKRNLFYGGKALHAMSDTFKHYLAGQMHCLPDIMPFFAPTVNSYKRLVEGLWAPTRLTWGIDNRTVPFRVIPGSEKSTRLETRVPGSDINPYLAIAAALASGLYGIEHKLPLKTKPTSGSAYVESGAKRLPKNLLEATEALAKSKIAVELFGKAFVEHFVATRLWEWRQFEAAVTTWELERYFEII